jgi:hypothetical protein
MYEIRPTTSSTLQIQPRVFGVVFGVYLSAQSRGFGTLNPALHEASTLWVMSGALIIRVEFVLRVE